MQTFSSVKRNKWIDWKYQNIPRRLSPLGVFFLVVAKIIEMESLAIIVGKLGAYFCTVMLGLFIHGFGTIAVIFFICCRELPYRYISRMGQNLATAFGTGSRFVENIKMVFLYFIISIAMLSFQLGYDASYHTSAWWHGHWFTCHTFCYSGKSVIYMWRRETKWKNILSILLTVTVGGCYCEHGWHGIVWSGCRYFHCSIAWCWAFVRSIGGR